MHGHSFVNAVAYFSGQVTKIYPNAKIENKKKRRLSEVRTVVADYGKATVAMGGLAM